MDSLRNFITDGVPLRSLRARRLRYYTCTTYQSLFKVVVSMYFSFRFYVFPFVGFGAKQNKTRQCFIWSLIQSYVHRLYPNNLKS